ncbi:MAG TPA: hypothetical protein VIF37_12725 [Methylobacter sp.]|jgi:hypothetical protein
MASAPAKLNIQPTYPANTQIDWLPAALEFPVTLEDRLHALDAAKNPKYGLLNSIYENFKKLDQTPANWIGYLLNPQEVALNVKNPPPYYFTRRFKDFPAKQPEFPTNKVDAHDYLYDYQDAGCTAVGGYSPTSFWVDFSDVKFGGGIFGNGYAQEETMMAEAPDLANAAAFGREFQQDGGVQTSVIVPRQWKKGQKYGDPTPVIIMGANRVAKVVWDLSGDFKKATATFLTAPPKVQYARHGRAGPESHW